ncbi:MAG: acylneuraminate cytidylyltransferase family protein [Candidatus Omnitrophota bacterium]|nr:MAG: acylneuraminate cytidylyltransferase family protein [Candidatus Omnitrophota bacterium]
MGKDKLKRMQFSLLGVIPARAGSKGIKNKNIREVCGRPLIYYTIKNSLGHREIYKTIVTTDSLEIARVARRYNVEVPFIRPKALAKDNTSMLDVLRHALSECERKYHIQFDGIILFDPTSPLRDREDIKEMIKIFMQKKPDLVVGVAKSRRNPYFNMLKMRRKRYAGLVLEANFSRRQDAPHIFDIANNCWIFSRRAVLSGWRIPKKTIAYQIKGPYVDIDREEDLELLEWYLKKMRVFQ